MPIFSCAMMMNLQQKIPLRLAMPTTDRLMPPSSIARDTAIARIPTSGNVRAIDWKFERDRNLCPFAAAMITKAATMITKSLTIFASCVISFIYFTKPFSLLIYQPSLVFQDLRDLPAALQFLVSRKGGTCDDYDADDHLLPGRINTYQRQ